MNDCYSDTLDNFMRISKSQWLEQMEDNLDEICSEEASDAQIRSWIDCFDVLQEELKDFAAENPDIHIVFEYVLRYTSKKRPDVLIISQDKLAILEFKRKDAPLFCDRAQTEEYARNIFQYHAASSAMKLILPTLVLTGTTAIETHKEGRTFVVSKGHLSEFLMEKMDHLTPLDSISSWIDAPYRELPTIVEAAIAKRKRKPLPEYEIARRAGLVESEECLKEQLQIAENDQKYVIAFVTGVPGAGKTLLGIDLAYDNYDDINNIYPTYISENGPLVSVLQDALQTDAFVRNIHTYLDQYTTDGAPEFHYNVCVFDEGQRTWTSEQRARKRKARPDMSEAALMIELIDTHVDWCFLLVLLGNGQEINRGEENGIELWKQAINRSSNNWEVICPPALDAAFEGCHLLKCDHREKLRLNSSLRSNCSQNFSMSINALIAGDIAAAQALYNDQSKARFPVYITRNLDVAKTFCRAMYFGDSQKRYGLHASSQGSILQSFGVNNSYEATQLTRTFPAKWYNEKPGSMFSCCTLTKTVTEFSCQGLEIDMPIVCWSNDVIWNNHNWETYTFYNGRRSIATNLKRMYRLNTYRVLLTRGRDGMIIFVPPVPELDSTYQLLCSLGYEEIQGENAWMLT